MVAGSTAGQNTENGTPGYSDGAAAQPGRPLPRRSVVTGMSGS